MVQKDPFCRSAQQCVVLEQGEAAMVPEDVGQKAAHMLLEEVSRGGVTDGTHQVSPNGKTDYVDAGAGAVP